VYLYNKMPRNVPVSARRLVRSVAPKPFIPKPQVEQPTEPAKPVQTRPWDKDWAPKSGETNSQRIFRRAQEAIEQGQPHFRVGGKEVYFPQAKITLLRPSAKHTPYQAKFIVPRNFNKLDLRDYLFHVYGLRALNVTTQLLWSRWEREQPGRPRYRTPQIKKMTIEMEDPFIWPEPVSEEVQKKEYRMELHEEIRKYAEDVDRIGSDKLKPPKAFSGLVGPYVPPPEPFVPKNVKRQLTNKKKAAEQAQSHAKEEELVKNYLGL
jgi:large subunit ribosomal protein L23